MAGCYVAGWLVYLERLFCVTVFGYPAQVGGNLKGIALDQAVIRVCVCVCGYPSAVVWRVRVRVIAAIVFERVCVCVFECW